MNTLLGHIAGSISSSVDGNQLVMWLKPHNQCAKKCWTGRDRKAALGIHLTSKLDVGIQSNNSKDNCGQHSNQDVGAGHPSQIKNFALGIHIPLYAMPSLTTYKIAWFSLNEAGLTSASFGHHTIPTSRWIAGKTDRAASTVSLKYTGACSTRVLKMKHSILLKQNSTLSFFLRGHSVIGFL